MEERIRELVKTFDLQAHPEGGYFKETYRTVEIIPGTKRNYLTSIYFLLVANEVSHFHRIKSDECWYFHEGSPLEIHQILPNGTHEVLELGLDLSAHERPFHVVPGNTIFGSHVKNFEGYALVSCAVSPGFDFADFELFTRSELMALYPHLSIPITRLTPDE